jgi:hypothetical protein
MMGRMMVAGMIVMKSVDIKEDALQGLEGFVFAFNSLHAIVCFMGCEGGVRRRMR